MLWLPLRYLTTILTLHYEDVFVKIEISKPTTSNELIDFKWMSPANALKHRLYTEL